MNLNDLKNLYQELNRYQLPISILCFDGKEYYTSKIKYNEKELFVDCKSCLSRMIFDNMNSWNCISCGESIKNEFNEK